MGAYNGNYKRYIKNNCLSVKLCTIENMDHVKLRVNSQDLRNISIITQPFKNLKAFSSLVCVGDDCLFRVLKIAFP